MIRSLLTTLIALIYVTFAPASHANILTNGSFEDPVVPINSYRIFRIADLTIIGANNGTPWIYSYTNTYGALTYVIHPGSGGKTTPFGNQYYQMGEPSVFTITTQGVHDLVPGHYELSFWQASYSGTSGAVAVDFRGGMNLLTWTSMLAGGQKTFTTASGSDAWEKKSVQFDIPSVGPYYVAFSSVPGSYGVIDNVELNLMPSLVPEPGSYALMLAGLGVIGCWARRRSKAVSCAA